MHQLFVSNQQLIELNLNPYNSAGFVTDELSVYSVEEFLEFREMYDHGQNFYYSIHWEGEPIHTETGEAIESVY